MEQTKPPIPNRQGRIHQAPVDIKRAIEERHFYRTVVCLFNGQTFLFEAPKLPSIKWIVKELKDYGVDYYNRELVVSVTSFELTNEMLEKHDTYGK